MAFKYPCFILAIVDTHEATQAPIPSPLRQSIIAPVRPDKLDDFMKVVEFHILRVSKLELALLQQQQLLLLNNSRVEDFKVNRIEV